MYSDWLLALSDLGLTPRELPDDWGNNSGIHSDEDWPLPDEPLTKDVDLEPLES